MKKNKFGKTRKNTRWKRGEFVAAENEKKSESEDGGMRELREIFEVVEVGKHSRGNGCQLVVIERDEEQMKMRGEGERNGMRDKPDC